jgi:3-oxoacyl-[acyl-carrier protein] reductase
MDLGIEGRVALVMGASKGIGNAIGVALAREGARVALASRDPERIAAAADDIGSGAVGIAADTADLERLSRLPADAAELLGGPVEILITNTGGPPLGQALDADLDAWRQAYEHLVLAPRVLIEAALPAMRERGWGRIVNVGSSSTEEPIPGLTLSNAHRRAAVGFLKTLAGEVAGDGVTVNDVATGRFATDRLRENWGGEEAMRTGAIEGLPAGRLGEPAEYGDLVAFLCSERAAYVTGASIPIDGGLLRSV